MARVVACGCDGDVDTDIGRLFVLDISRHHLKGRRCASGIVGLVNVCVLLIVCVLYPACKNPRRRKQNLMPDILQIWLPRSRLIETDEKG